MQQMGMCQVQVTDLKACERIFLLPDNSDGWLSLLQWWIQHMQFASLSIIPFILPQEQKSANEGMYKHYCQQL